MEMRFNNYYQPPYNLEVLRMGCWESIDILWDLEEILWIASSHVHALDGLPEDKIRIIDNNNKII